MDDRDSLDSEFSNLQFLWGNGEHCIPEPIMADRNARYAVYEFIEGEKITSEQVTNFDIDFAVNFLIRLNRLKEKNNSKCVPPASEACFSVQDIVKVVEFRLHRLSIQQSLEPQYRTLNEFLTNEFIPSFEQITKWCKLILKKSGMSFVSYLDPDQRTLSPSDFGFHNSLRRSDSQLIFMDFEYFGWDDPAKMITDFLLHPAMDLNKNLRQRFFTNIVGHFKNQNQLKRRIEILLSFIRS